MGGTFLDHNILPLSEKYSLELQTIEEKFFALRSISDDMIEFVESNSDSADSYVANYQQIEFALLDATNELTEKLTVDFKKTNALKGNLDLSLPVINALVYIITIYGMFKTLRKETEQIQKLEKLYTIGQMASRLAHDLKNPLTVIKASLDMIEHKSPYKR